MSVDWHQLHVICTNAGKLPVVFAAFTGGQKAIQSIDMPNTESQELKEWPMVRYLCSRRNL